MRDKEICQIITSYLIGCNLSLLFIIPFCIMAFQWIQHKNLLVIRARKTTFIKAKLKYQMDDKGTLTKNRIFENDTITYLDLVIKMLCLFFFINIPKNHRVTLSYKNFIKKYQKATYLKQMYWLCCYNFRAAKLFIL